MPDRPIVVELVGLAGSGKSTLARELVAEEPAFQLGLPLSRARSAGAQVAAISPFVLPYLRDVKCTAWFTRDEARGLGYMRAWRATLTRRRVDAPCILLDHGPLFRLAQLDAFGSSVTSTAAFQRWWCDTLDEWADLLDLVVWLDASDELLVHRIQSRDQRHVIRSADYDVSRRFLDRYRASYDRVLDRIRDRSADAVCSLRTDADPPSALAMQVRRRLSASVQFDV